MKYLIAFRDRILLKLKDTGITCIRAHGSLKFDFKWGLSLSCFLTALQETLRVYFQSSFGIFQFITRVYSLKLGVDQNLSC